MLTKIQQFLRLQTLKLWYTKYERILLPVTMIGGVLLDAFTFRSINITSTFILLTFYFILAGATLFFVHAYDSKRISSRKATDYLRLAAPLIIQFTYGALLSGVFVFYFFSGTLFVSWPLLGLLLLLMVSNEIFKKYYTQTTLQLGVYFFILFSLLSIAIPFFTESLSTKIFLMAGVISLLWMFGILELLYLIKQESKMLRVRLSVTILLIFLFLNGLYFAKVIPPIPLSIREMTVAHSVERQGTNYNVAVEPRSLFDRLFKEQIFHKDPQGGVYLYTAIFAPGKLQTKIIHEWEYYDEVKKEWLSRSELSFGITGGRTQGYRGYSLKNNVPAGLWRVYVKTASGQVLGRMTFRVVDVDQAPVQKKLVK